MPESHKDLLSLGPKFVPAPKKIPHMDIITTTEAAALKLEFSTKSEKICSAQVLRKDVLRILKNAKPVQDNLTQEQRRALTEISKDPDIRVYPFDKGTGMVRISNADAIRKIREQIGETEIIQEDPTNKFARDIQIELSKLNKRGRFTVKEYERVYPSDAIPPRMYGTVKAHKPEKNHPMRLVVSTVGTPPHGLSAHLVKIIQPTLNKNPSRLKNSAAFVDIAKNWEISPTEVQVSYDVVNLYPSIPLKRATKVIIDLLQQDEDLSRRTKLKIPEIKLLIELCLSKCYFLWNDEIHLLKDSGPIGLSLMVVMAEGFLQVLEERAIHEALHMQPPTAPITHYRYVDDTHNRFIDENKPHAFLEVLNRQDESTTYTMEVENENKELSYLEIMSKNPGTGKYEFDIYRKKAITNVQVKPESCHDPKILRGIFKGFLNRAYRICSTKYLEKEIEFLVKIFKENGYDEEQLRKSVNEVKSKWTNEAAESTENSEESNNQEARETVTIPWIPGVSPRLKKAFRKAGYKVVCKSGRSIGSILTVRNKTKLPQNSYPGVYVIPCSCGIAPYRGQTKKRTYTRIEEHHTNIEKEEWGKSAVALHSKNCNGRIEFEKAKTVAVVHKTFERKVRESLEIQKHDCHVSQGGMNPDRGQYMKTNFWYPMLKYLKKTEEKQESGYMTSNLTSHR